MIGSPGRLPWLEARRGRIGLALPAGVLLLSLAAVGWGSNHEPRATDNAAPPWSDLLRAHLARYPLAQAEDVYKFAHQSVFGPAHAIASKEEARRYLDEEVAALPPGPPDEPPLDALSEDPPLTRVNLRPFLAAGRDRERLLDAFVATAARVHGDPAVMRARLAVAAAALRDLGRAHAAGQLEALAADRAAGGYPASHHSAAYRDAYRPAYRVVLTALLADSASTPGSAPGSVE